MTVKDLETVFDYSRWANKLLFNAMSQLTTEQFTQSVGGSYGSVQNTMVHMLSAEWGWLERCGGPPRGPSLKAVDFPTLESLRGRYAEVEGYVRDFLATLKDQDLDRVVEFALGAGPKHAMRLGDLMHHAMNHGVHHRGQAALLLRMLGQTPGNFDILFYYARPEAQAASH